MTMCNAACVKIIINGGFMAALAPRVAEVYGQEGEIGPAAARLGKAATLLMVMAAARGLSVTRTDNFDGCAQASAMVHWITGGITDGTFSSAKGIAKQMDEWTAELWQHIADLATGKPLA